LINERIWLGHFEGWLEDGVLLFRHASVLEEDQYGASLNLCETLIETALCECERYYPVFQFVIWAGKTPLEAIKTAMLETVGEA
ncbi:MAG: YbjN domain-containing protein, partial [Sphingomonadales bacterium]